MPTPKKVEIEAATLEMALERVVTSVIDEDYSDPEQGPKTEVRFVGVKVDLWRRRKYGVNGGGVFWEFEVS